MRVALAKGRIDHEAEATFAGEIDKRPPFYFFSWIMHDLERACRGKGWDVDVVFVGKPTPQRLQLPDVLVNLITEPLVCRRALDRLDTMVRPRAIPMLNSVEAIRRSSRVVLPDVIAGSGAPRVRAPRTARFSGRAAAPGKHVEAAGLRWPVLLRPAGTHSSKGLTKVDSPSALRALDLPHDVLVSEFIDFRSGDGLYRKYRMIWVDGMVFRRHLLAGFNWNVTGDARIDMAMQPETITAEKDFLASPGPLDDRIAELFRIVGLDFGVIDFAVSDEGEITIFELNGTFQISGSIPKNSREAWGYLEANNADILNALLDAIARRARKS
jgi:hypothetical protein